MVLRQQSMGAIRRTRKQRTEERNESERNVAGTHWTRVRKELDPHMRRHLDHVRDGRVVRDGHDLLESVLSEELVQALAVMPWEGRWSRSRSPETQPSRASLSIARLLQDDWL
jgi:hypothetical protein